MNKNIWNVYFNLQRTTKSKPRNVLGTNLSLHRALKLRRDFHRQYPEVAIQVRNF